MFTFHAGIRDSRAAVYNFIHACGYMETEWTITKVESFWSYCPASAEIGIAIVYSIAFVFTIKILIRFFIFLLRKNDTNSETKKSG